jgi:hypothetical protein
MDTKLPTTIRFSEEDREILEKLQKFTGLESHTAVIRLAIREALASRVGHTRETKYYVTKTKPKK